MAYEYGYGELEDNLIELFRSGAPDFEKARELLRQGADLNAVGKDSEENILSEILQGYWWTEYPDQLCERSDNCDKDDCGDCKFNISKNPNCGAAMCEIIRFFLKNGFDVTKNDGCYGAQCLYALTLSTFDRYVIEAVKLLFDAGAVNRTISPAADVDSTPLEFISTECSFQFCEGKIRLANIYEAIYQLYLAADERRPYSGIDSYEAAVGKKILKVLAAADDDKTVFFSLDLPEYKKDNCFNTELYFVFDEGILIVTQYGDMWTDTVLPDKDLADISGSFSDFIGSRIESFGFDCRTIIKGTTHYNQPVISVMTDNGHGLMFSINFGEVKEEDRAAYFEIINRCVSE